MINVMKRFRCMMSFFIITALVLLTATACADPGPIELHTKFVDADVQEMLAAKLRTEGIPFRQTPDGTIWYPLRERERVQSISQKIVKNEYPGYTVQYDSPEHTRLFREKLTQQNIPFHARVRGNKELTSWNEKDDSKVQEVLVYVRQMIIEEKKVEILKRHR